MNTLHFLILILNIFLSLSKALIIVRHRRITKEMQNMFQATEYPDSDPRHLKDLQTRQEICDEVITAREYIVINTRDDLPDITSNERGTPLDPETHNVQRIQKCSVDENSDVHFLTETKVVVNNMYKTKSMKLLHCVQTDEKTKLVLFDGKTGQMLLIELVRWHTRYVRRWTAFIDAEAEYNLLFRGPRAQERLFNYFSKQIISGTERESRILSVPKEMTLCNLSFVDHARVCSASFETLRERRVGYFNFPAEVKHMNIVHLGPKRCMKKRIQLTPETELNVNVVPCSINQDKQYPQFFIFADKKKPGAIFILVTLIKRMSRVRRKKTRNDKLRLVARLENLPIRKHWKTAENSYTSTSESQDESE